MPGRQAPPNHRAHHRAPRSQRGGRPSTHRNGSEAEGAPKGAPPDPADLLDQIGQAADLSPRPGVEREGVNEGDERMVLLGRRGADSGVAAMGGPGIGVRCS